MAYDPRPVIEYLTSGPVRRAADYIQVSSYCIEHGDIDLAGRVIETANSLYGSNSAVQARAKLLQQYAPMRTAGTIARKVFGIGLSRTATNSLAHALSTLGLRTAHWTTKPNDRIIGWDDILTHDALCDTPISFIFETLYYSFPGAYFIYTTRDLDKWGASVDRHFRWLKTFKRLSEICERPAKEAGSVVDTAIWKVIHQSLYANHDSWVDAYRAFDSRVRDFFASKPSARFLEIDLTADVGDRAKWERLCGFLDYSSIPLLPFPQKNVKAPRASEAPAVNDGNPFQGRLTEAAVTRRLSLMMHDQEEVCVHRVHTKVTFARPNSAPDYYIFRSATKDVPDIRIFRIRNALLSVDFTNGSNYKFYVFQPDRRLIPQFSHGTEPFISETLLQSPHARVAFLEDKFTKFNVCHFLLDKLSRIHLFAGQDIDSGLVFVDSDYVTDAMNLVNLTGWRITPQKDQPFRQTYVIPELYISSSSFWHHKHPAHHASAWALDFLRSHALTWRKPAVGKPSRRIFISRQEASTRKILNMEEVSGVLEANGFEVIALEGLTLAEQIDLFRQAHHVAGVHGAGLTNLLFSEPGTVVSEILPPLCATAAYWELSGGMGHRYDAMIARDPELATPDYTDWKHDAAKYNRRDVIVPPAALHRLLNAAERTPERPPANPKSEAVVGT